MGGTQLLTPRLTARLVEVRGKCRRQRLPFTGPDRPRGVRPAEELLRHLARRGEFQSLAGVSRPAKILAEFPQPAGIQGSPRLVLRDRRHEESPCVLVTQSVEGIRKVNGLGRTQRAGRLRAGETLTELPPPSLPPRIARIAVERRSQGPPLRGCDTSGRLWGRETNREDVVDEFRPDGLGAAASPRQALRELRQILR